MQRRTQEEEHVIAKQAEKLIRQWALRVEI
jgi:hypothetical protein